MSRKRARDDDDDAVERLRSMLGRPDDHQHPAVRLSRAAAAVNLPVNSADFASLLDQADNLRNLRQEFHFPLRAGASKTAETALAAGATSSDVVSAVATDAGAVASSQRSDEMIEQDQVDDVGEQCVYFTGNSLGLQPRGTEPLILEELAKWRTHGVEGHFEGSRPWLTADDYVLSACESLVGARKGAGEAAVMNGLTTNLHLMMIAFYRPTPEKHKIIIEQQPFPSDLYAVQSQLRLHGFDPEKSLVQVAPRPGARTVHEDDVLAELQRQRGSVALLMMSGVQYYTGQLFDMARLTKAAHAAGALAGFDLAHAVGNAVLRLHDWDVDFAVWCGYKYLNGGPGTIAGLFVHERHAAPASVPTRLAGWWGQNLTTRFDMRQPFDPIPGAYGFRLSNPPILQLTALLAALQVFEKAGFMEPLRAKSLLLTGFLELLLEDLNLLKRGPRQSRLEQAAADDEDEDENLTRNAAASAAAAGGGGTAMANGSSTSSTSPPLSFPLELLTPRETHRRGCQLSLLFARPELLIPVAARLKRLGYVIDLRKPDSMRLAPVPLYNSFTDVWKFANALKSSIELCDVK